MRDDLIEKCSECFLNYLTTKTQEDYKKFASLFEQMSQDEMICTLNSVKSKLDLQENNKRK